MEGGSRKRDDHYPQLLDLIHKNKEWVMRGNERKFRGVEEEKKLELKLGPPGEEEEEEAWFINANYKNNSTEKFENHHSLSFSCFSSMISKTHNQNPSSMETQPATSTIFTTSWCPVSSSSSSPSPSSSTFHLKTQQQFQPYLQFQSVSQNLPAVSKESSQLCSTKVVVELQKNQTEKTSCLQPSPAKNITACNSSQKRTAPAPVVGWPPIRSFRKNLSNVSSLKPASESENGGLPKEEASTKKTENCRKSMFVKINMDGVPIGRKVDLKAYDSYEKLSSAVDELFRRLLAAQKDSFTAGVHNNVAEVEAITDLLDGTGEYTLVYEDHEGDRMLVGDVPWDMFASTVKRLRVLKSSELSALRLGSSKQEKTPLDSAVKM